MRSLQKILPDLDEVERHTNDAVEQVAPPLVRPASRRVMGVSLSGVLPAHFRGQATLAWPRCGAAASTVLQRPTGGAGQRPELDVRRFLPHTFFFLYYFFKKK